MPYCHKCGAKLDDTARFCYVCGTPVTQISPYASQTAPAPTGQQVRRATFPLAAIAIIIIVVLAVAALAVAFLPFVPVNFSQENQASAPPNVNALQLVVDADIANVNVMLKDLPGNQRVATNVTATGWRGIFNDDHPISLSFKEDTNDSTLNYLVNVTRSSTTGLNLVTVFCYVYVDPSVTLNILVQTDTGAITLDAERDSTFQQLILSSQTGSINAILKDKPVVTGDVVLDAQTGSIQLLWDNAKITHNIDVGVTAATGSANLNINQTTQLVGNVTLSAQATTGSVDLTMAIKNDVGARISATTNIGRVNVQQTGFSSNQAPLQSQNYPASGDFNVELNANTGSINVDANYELGAIRT